MEKKNWSSILGQEESIIHFDSIFDEKPVWALSWREGSVDLVEDKEICLEGSEECLSGPPARKIQWEPYNYGMNVTLLLFLLLK